MFYGWTDKEIYGKILKQKDIMSKNYLITWIYRKHFIDEYARTRR